MNASNAIRTAVFALTAIALPILGAITDNAALVEASPVTVATSVGGYTVNDCDGGGDCRDDTPWG